MKRRIIRHVAAIMLFWFSISFVYGQTEHRGIKLLPGFICTPVTTVDSVAGAISKRGGLLIEFEEGLNQGVAVAVGDPRNYEWSKEQIISGHRVKVAFIKHGARTVWEPDRPRTAENGGILLVSVPLSKHADHAINFRSEILSAEELIEALLMIFTYDKSAQGTCATK